MASEIRVNQIQNRSGLSTVTFSDTGVVISGITTISDLRTSGNTIVAAGTAAAPSISPTGDSNTGIFFPAPDTVAIAEGGVEALRVDSSGRLGVGITNPSTKLEIVGSYSSGAITTSFKISGSGWSVGGGPSLEFGHDPASYPTWVTGRIASTYSGGNWGGGLKFFYNNGTTAATLTEGMELTRDGNLAFPSGKGIDFSATANSSGTMTSELLDDYEIGTFTPNIVGHSASGVIGTGSITGKYTKIGNIVTYNILWIQITFSSAPSGIMKITGLPFVTASSKISGYVSQEGIDMAFTKAQGTNGGGITFREYDTSTNVAFRVATSTGWDNYMMGSSTFGVTGGTSWYGLATLIQYTS